MTKLCSLPREMLLKIFAHLPFSDPVSVGRTCAQLWYLVSHQAATSNQDGSSLSTDFGNDYTCYTFTGEDRALFF